jgi:hypothetical protein
MATTELRSPEIRVVSLADGIIEPIGGAERRAHTSPVSRLIWPFRAFLAWRVGVQIERFAEQSSRRLAIGQ